LAEGAGAGLGDGFGAGLPKDERAGALGFGVTDSFRGAALEGLVGLACGAVLEGAAAGEFGTDRGLVKSGRAPGLVGAGPAALPLPRGSVRTDAGGLPGLPAGLTSVRVEGVVGSDRPTVGELVVAPPKRRGLVKLSSRTRSAARWTAGELASASVCLPTCSWRRRTPEGGADACCGSLGRYTASVRPSRDNCSARIVLLPAGAASWMVTLRISVRLAAAMVVVPGPTLMIVVLLLPVT
jgi:hypothetical protein